MWKKAFQVVYPHLLVLLAFFLIAFVYFLPAYEGKSLFQPDVMHFNGMAKEIVDFRNETGKEPLWTNSAFGGMPAYQISTLYKENLVQYVHRIFMVGKTPANFLFLAFIGFYILMVVLGVRPLLGALGSIAFGFSSYFLIILAVGHNSKFVAMAYMAPVIAGMILAYRKHMLAGVALFGLALALQVYANHFQITYYLVFMVLLYGIFELVQAWKNKTIKKFALTTSLLAIISLVAALSDLNRLYTTWEYTKYSTRGQSELTSDNNSTSGLDKDYATSWSYGKWETLTLLIPNFQGGASGGELSTSSHTYQWLKANQYAEARNIIKNMPLYWGPQEFTEGPVYFGAIIIFLFVLGLILVKGPLKWWLVSITILSVVLGWGRYFPLVTNFFLDYVPMYNKFRTVSMILVIAQFAVPLLAVLMLKEFMEDKYSKKEFFNAFKWALGIAGGICLFFTVFPGMFFDFVSHKDALLLQNGYNEEIMAAIREDRRVLLQGDALRSLFFILAAAGLLYFAFIKKLSVRNAIVFLGLIILVDLWSVDRRYLNEDRFVSKTQVREPYKASKADQFILQDKALSYRVLNLSVSPFQDASTSWFHKSIGGYHGAKMKKYQELIDHRIFDELMTLQKTFSQRPTGPAVDSALASITALNLLNTKYIILNPQYAPLENPYALGNAWFVKDYRIVENADEEIAALNTISPLQTAVVDKRFAGEIGDLKIVPDSAGRILLTEYKPNYLKYQSSAATDQLVVFSEIFYDKGWNAYVDGELNPHFRTDYTFRGMVVPSGTHTIEFRFEPRSYELGKNISLATSLMLILLFAGIFGQKAYNLIYKNE
ncbi:MAG: YfhO family protein [Bacteroidales bacterium]